MFNVPSANHSGSSNPSQGRTSSESASSGAPQTLPQDPGSFTTPKGRQRKFDEMGVNPVFDKSEKRNKVFIPNRRTFVQQNLLHAVNTHVTSNAVLNRKLDNLGLDAPDNRFTIEGWIKQGVPFNFRFRTPAGQDVRVIRNTQSNEGGDKVWASPPNSVHHQNLPTRPASVPPHRVITKLEGQYGDPKRLYREDLQSNCLFVGYGAGQDYRTSRASLRELAKSGVTVIGIDLAKSLNARQDIPYIADAL